MWNLGPASGHMLLIICQFHNFIRNVTDVTDVTGVTRPADPALSPYGRNLVITQGRNHTSKYKEIISYQRSANFIITI